MINILSESALTVQSRYEVGTLDTTSKEYWLEVAAEIGSNYSGLSAESPLYRKAMRDYDYAMSQARNAHLQH